MAAGRPAGWPAVQVRTDSRAVRDRRLDQPQGTPRAPSARAALPALADQLQLTLAPLLPGPTPGQSREPMPATRALALDTRFVRNLDDLGPCNPALGLVPLPAPPMLRPCLGLGHPLGRARVPGARLAYVLDAQKAGPVGVLTFAAVPLRPDPRDQHIGLGRPRPRPAHPLRGVQRPLPLPAGRVGSQLERYRRQGTLFK